MEAHCRDLDAGPGGQVEAGVEQREGGRGRERGGPGAECVPQRLVGGARQPGDGGSGVDDHPAGPAVVHGEGGRRDGEHPPADADPAQADVVEGLEMAVVEKRRSHGGRAAGGGCGVGAEVEGGGVRGVAVH